MHVYAKNIYIWDPSCILEIPPHGQTHVLDQTYNAGNPVSVPLGLWQWHSMYVCQSLSDLAPVCLSVCFNTIRHCRLCACLSVWPSICSIRQSILFGFDSWCVTLYVCLSDVIQVQCARAESSGVTIRFFFFTLAISPVIGHSPVWFFLGMHMCMQNHMQCEHEYRYALVHIRWHGERMLRCRSSSTVWPVALLWSNCEVF